MILSVYIFIRINTYKICFHPHQYLCLRGRSPTFSVILSTAKKGVTGTRVYIFYNIRYFSIKNFQQVRIIMESSTLTKDLN